MAAAAPAGGSDSPCVRHSCSCVRMTCVVHASVTPVRFSSNNSAQRKIRSCLLAASSIRMCGDWNISNMASLMCRIATHARWRCAARFDWPRGTAAPCFDWSFESFGTSPDSLPTSDSSHARTASVSASSAARRQSSRTRRASPETAATFRDASSMATASNALEVFPESVSATFFPDWLPLINTGSFASRIADASSNRACTIFFSCSAVYGLNTTLSFPSRLLIFGNRRSGKSRVCDCEGKVVSVLVLGDVWTTVTSVRDKTAGAA